MWRVKDEYLDLKQGRHVVIYHNADTGAEHHLINLFGLDACPTCGHDMTTHEGDKLDFHRVKVDKLFELNEHHKRVTNYRSKHHQVDLRSHPKP